jgi:hypothetical protein
VAKKKKKRRGTSAAAGVDPNEKRRERLEARRAAKAEAQRAAQKQAQRNRLIRRIVLFGVLALAIFLVVRQFQDLSGPSEINGHEIKRFSAEGENQHTDEQVTYETTPPVSGRHRPSPPACGVYGTQLEDGLFVHGLEHGAVGVLYQPTLPLEDIRRIERIAGEYDSHVITMPYEGMEPVVAVASWGERMDLQELDAAAVRTYIDEFRDEGPEDQPCDMDEDTPFEPAEATPAPTATPSPEST